MAEVINPIVHEDTWNELSLDGVVWEDGGFVTPLVPDSPPKFLYLFHPRHTPREHQVLALWDGGHPLPVQEPDPLPEPGKMYKMPREDWERIRGGILTENFNWVMVPDPEGNTGELFEILAMEHDDGTLEALTCRVP